MGRSYIGPSFLTFAGARFTVTLDSIFLYPELPIAVMTRSLASFTAWSGRPTSVNCMEPDAAHTSISTVWALTP